jgi:hypothetical protein
VRITSFQRLPCCVTKDNTFVVAIEYDYVAWTEQVAKAAEKMLDLKHGNESYAGFASFTSGDLREHDRNLRSVDSKSDLRSGTLTRNGLLNLSSGRHPGHPHSPRSVFRYGF